jgi:acyl-CoA thioester hydrolase
MRSGYVHWTRELVRWGDMDAFGHVNNAVFFTYCESARIRLFQALDLEGLARGQPGKLGPGLVNASVNYRRQVHYPAELDVGLRIARVGGKSFTVEYGVFLAGADAPVADGASVLVWMDYAARGGEGEALTLPDVLRERLKAFEAPRP